MTAAGDARQAELARWKSPDGVIVGIAVDHRDALVSAWQRRNGMPPTRPQVEELKARVVQAVGPEATVLLLDAEYGRPQMEAGALPGGVALVMPLEEQGYDAVGDGRVTRLMADFGPAHAASLGAAGCKLLLPYHPDDVDSAARQEVVVREVVAACHASGMPLVLEPIVYRRGGEPEDAFDARLPARVTTTAARLATLGPDVLKLQFPSGSADDLAACREVTRACGEVPWVLLGAGSDADTFAGQVEVAMRGGAIGFIVGRTVWGGALTPDAAASEAFLASEAVPMFRRFRDIALGRRPMVVGRT